MAEQYSEDFLSAGNLHSVIHSLMDAIHRINSLEQRVKELESDVDTMSKEMVRLIFNDSASTGDEK